jgi:hypothetical protein
MANEKQLSSHRDAKQNGRRVFADGVLWFVFELPPTPYDRRQSPSLVFESDATVRRVRNYPANWRTLTDAELLALSWAV